ncbi:MAG: BLUF domain-containing protein [Polaromonas sp.]|uniref:BLUF domain-containing protein n=1 Tax=Polaromonas sp. TaxID=1869339 RepID=UPI002488B67B|nr:BLUF domain-containing protein [Polaromonas sp.]MDI1239116.1 BLUF domain-containing protein [Polaromonas sp.]MDI1342152.1 BLUF domain-containing protein [Polaromonas sp.]
MLVQLTYASRTASVLGANDVKDILAASKRNNALAGVTGALCLNNGIFLQQLEGDKAEVNALYHRLLRDERHRDPAILDFSEITQRRFGSWSMGLLSSLEENRQIFQKYSGSRDFDPYAMSVPSLRAFFNEIVDNVRWLG